MFFSCNFCIFQLTGQSLPLHFKIITHTKVLLFSSYLGDDSYSFRALRMNFYYHYHPFRNHYTHEITIFELFRRLQLQLSGVFRTNLHYSYSFLVFLAEWSYSKELPSGIPKNFWQLQLFNGFRIRNAMISKRMAHTKLLPNRTL